MEKHHLSITVAMLFVFALVSVTPAHAADPIDIGSRKQLFIDDRFIESSEGITLVMNPPRRDGIVLLTNDEPWETGPDTYIGVYSSVIKENGVVRLWYDSRRGGDQRYGRVAYAESKDGHIGWKKVGVIPNANCFTNSFRLGKSIVE